MKTFLSHSCFFRIDFKLTSYRDAFHAWQLGNLVLFPIVPKILGDSLPRWSYFASEVPKKHTTGNIYHCTHKAIWIDKYFFSYMLFVLFVCGFNNILKDNNLKPRLSYYSWHLHFETWPSSSSFPKPTFTPTVHFDEWYHPATRDHALFLILSLCTAKYCWPGLFFTGIYATQTDIIKGNNSTDLPNNFYYRTEVLLDLDKNPLFLLGS